MEHLVKQLLRILARTPATLDGLIKSGLKKSVEKLKVLHAASSVLLLAFFIFCTDLLLYTVTISFTVGTPATGRRLELCVAS